jgi:hypothetical protein
MNRFLFILMLLPAGSALAQTETLQVIKPDTSRPDILTLKNRSSWLAKAKFSHNTSKGKIYILPGDNMPCLVPDTRKTIPMPGIRPVPDKRMPNAFPAIPFLPKGK